MEAEKAGKAPCACLGWQSVPDGAVIPWNFEPFPKIATIMWFLGRWGPNKCIKRQVSCPGADPQQGGIYQGQALSSPILQCWTASLLSLRAKFLPQCLAVLWECRNERAGLGHRLIQAKIFWEVKARATCLQKASSVDIFHTSFPLHPHQSHGWSHSSLCCAFYCHSPSAGKGLSKKAQWWHIPFVSCSQEET